MSELFDKQVNNKKKKNHGVHEISCKLMKKCDENGTRKKRRTPKIFLIVGRVVGCMHVER